MSARPSLALLVALALPAATFGPVIARAQDPSEVAPGPIEEAKALYQQGSTLYSAADYSGAIDKFTEALGIITVEGTEKHATIRGALLFNIAKAHANAYQIDQDAAHLRAAKSIFTRFIGEAEGGAYEDGDVAEAKAELARIDALLSKAEGPIEGPKPNPAPQVDERYQATRASGLGLTIAGAILVPTGAVLMGVSPIYRQLTCEDYDREFPSESAQVSCETVIAADEPPAPVTQTVYDRIQQDVRTGQAMLIGGGVTLGVGAVSLAVGIVQLVRAKKMAPKSEDGMPVGSLEWRPWLGRDGAGVGLRARF